MLQDAVARVADVPTDAVRITNIRSVQRRQLRRRLESSTVVVDYEIEATDSEAVARKLAEASPAVFDAAIQDAAEAAGAESAFADVRTEEISVASAEESEDDDDASTSKFASVKFIASVAAGCFCLAAALAVRWALRHRRGKKKTPGVVVEYPKLAYAQPVASAPLAPLAPEPPMAAIKERALAEAARATGEAEPEYGGAHVAPGSVVPGARSGGRVRPGVRATAGSPLLFVVHVSSRCKRPESLILKIRRCRVLSAIVEFEFV